MNWLKKKKISQPSQIKTCGSTFKNFNNQKKAWQLIKETGCDKFEVGDAVISKKHCNYFINDGTGTCKNLEDLIIAIKKDILKQYNIKIEKEVCIY